MRNRDREDYFEQQDRIMDMADESLSEDTDLVMEQILENISSTPIGQVLKKIASLPEVRKKKVLDLRQQLTAGRYNVTDHLDSALDKVLEDLTT
ncbi:MAG: flagellar biosynthesis anti-sigma factor FlgM [Planctomycetota bacterium]|jgi:hypothetical protein